MKNFLFLMLLVALAACQTPTTETAQNNTVVPNASPSNPIAQKAAYKEGGIKWMSLEEAQALAKKEPKKIIMDVYTHWCGPCKMLDRTTFADAKVIDHINTNYYAVKFNAESADPVTFKGKEYANPEHVPNRRGRNSPHQLTRAMGVRGYPTLMIFDSKLNVLKNLVGFKKPEQLLGELAGI